MDGQEREGAVDMETWKSYIIRRMDIVHDAEEFKTLSDNF